jgi:hypothetical protein
MNRIIERCPSCGVEHDEPTHECEACGSPVRFWCRTHSREIGWLESDVCPRCPPGAARPRPPKPAPPPAVAPTPAPSADGASRPYLRFEPKPPAASPPAAPVAPAAPAPAPEAPSAPEKARPNRRGMGVRLFEALLTVLQTGIVGVLVGVAYGGIAAYRVGAEVPLEAAIGGAKGGMAGLALGVLIAIATFHRSAHPREGRGG